MSRHDKHIPRSQIPEASEHALAEVQRMAPAAPDSAPGGNLDKVRDLLFGSQVRELEKKLARIEERLLKEESELRDELRKRQETQEAYVRKEIEALAERIKGEREARDAAIFDLSRGLKDSASALGKNLSHLEEQTSKAQRELRGLLSDQHSNLTNEIQRRAEEMARLLSRHLAEVRGEKADRTQLAALFTEMAVRLSNEPNFGNGE